MSRGATGYFIADATPSGIVSSLVDDRITHFLAVPTLLQVLVELRGKLSLQHIGYGSAPISPALLRDAIDVLGCRFSGVYGLSGSAVWRAIWRPTITIPTARTPTGSGRWAHRSPERRWRHGDPTAAIATPTSRASCG